MSRKKPKPPAEFDPEAPAIDTTALADDGSKRLLFGFAAVLFGAGFLVAVIAVLYRPERTVLVGMDARETAWFRSAVEEFSSKNHANLKVVSYASSAEFDSLLAADRAAKSHTIVLAEAPFDRLAALADSGRVLPLQKVKGFGSPAAYLGEFTAAASEPASVAGRPYYVPSRLTTLCLAYSKARVADAVAHASEVRGRVDGWLKAANGVGLPTGDRLEEDPAEWDSYDLLVVAAYWASQPFIDGTAPRVAHATAPASALAFDLSARAFSLGAKTDELLALDGFGVRDALAWESLFLEHGLYDTTMIARRWTPADVGKGVAAGRIWLATLEPSLIMRLAGLAADTTGGRPAPSGPSDIGLSRLPRGVSLELKNHYPERSGDPWSARAGAWWCVPTTSPDHGVALALLRHVTSAEFQAEASRTLGWLPTRKDLVDDFSDVFTRPEEFALARQAMRQLYDFGRPLPNAARWPRVAESYARAWEDACVEHHARSPLDLAEALRRAQPPPR